MSKTNLLDVLAAIESICGDDFCEELDCDNALVRKLRGRIAIAHDKLSQIYRLAHAFDTRRSCHHVHDNWREELKKFKAEEEPAPSAAERTEP